MEHNITIGVPFIASTRYKLDKVNCARLRRPYGGLGGYVYVMGEWLVSQWILAVMRFQKIFGLYSVERLKVEKWSG